MTKIGFVLLSNSKSPIPSTRITVLNLFPALRDAGFEPHIIFEPLAADETPVINLNVQALAAENFRLVYFQKVHGRSVEQLARQLSEVGIKTVYGVCDLVNEAMAAATDMTVTVTDYLKSLYPEVLQHKIKVVHDGIEHPEIQKTDFSLDRGSAKSPLKAVLVTSAALNSLPVISDVPEWLHIWIVGRYPKDVLQKVRTAWWQFNAQTTLSERLRYLKFLANRRISCIPWEADKVYDLMKAADIGIIPIQTPANKPLDQPAPSWKVKSENRLTMKMAIGLPVVATPIPAYEPIIQQGKNGFFANSASEWLQILEWLRDPELRKDIGRQARWSVIDKYSQNEQVKLLVDIFHGVT